MILTSTTEAVPFTPPWYKEGDEKSVTFMLRAGSVTERANLEADLAGRQRAGRVYGFELTQAIRSGIETLLADDPGQTELLALIDAEAQGGEVELDDAQKRQLAEVRQVLEEHWPPYADLVAQIARRRELAPIMALQRFCVGIEAPKVTFARGIDGRVSEATLRQLDDLDMLAAGNRAYAMLRAEDQAGNSAPPSSSADGQATSSTDGTSTVDGSSTAKPGRKTRGSRSQPGSGPS